MDLTSRMETIREIAIKSGKPFEYVMEVYTKHNSDVYFKNCKAGVMHLLYTPDLEKKVAELTEEECMK